MHGRSYVSLLAALFLSSLMLAQSIEPRGDGLRTSTIAAQTSEELQRTIRQSSNRSVPAVPILPIISGSPVQPPPTPRAFSLAWANSPRAIWFYSACPQSRNHLLGHRDEHRACFRRHSRAGCGHRSNYISRRNCDPRGDCRQVADHHAMDRPLVQRAALSRRRAPAVVSLPAQQSWVDQLRRCGYGPLYRRFFR